MNPMDERTVYAEYEDGTWFISSFDKGLIMADSYDELLARAQEAFGPDVQLADMESADAAKALGL